MWSHTYQHATPASPDAAWAVLADVDGWARWNDGIETLVLDGPVAAGTTFRMTPPGEDTVTSTIVEFDPPHVLTDLTELDGIAVRVEHRVEPDADGGSLVSFAVTVTGDAPDDVLAEIGGGVSADFPDVLANLAATAERSGVNR